MDDVAIKINDVSKEFKLPHEKNTSVKSAVVNFYKREKGYELQRALKDISLEIKKGEFFGIVGRNGSGKSTLLKLLAGIYTPTKGDIIVNGTLTPFIELGVGFNPELTGRENVYLNGALLGFSRKDMQSMYKDVVDFAELHRFMDQKLKNYSSGMQVRLAFSIAIRAQSDILLIDEVLAVGDADFQRKCFDYFKGLKKNKKTVILVSHDMNAINEFCDRAILIDNGEIIVEGQVRKVALKYSSLFLEAEDGDTTTNETGIRTGTGAIKAVKAHVSVLKDEIDITVLAEAYEDIEELIYGIHIIGQDGREITAMNNRMLGVPDIKDLKVGDKLKFNWKMLNIFSDGKYSVMLTLTNGAYVSLDILNDAATFRVRRTQRSNTPVLPPVKVSSSLMKP